MASAAARRGCGTAPVRERRRRRIFEILQGAGLLPDQLKGKDKATVRRSAKQRKRAARLTDGKNGDGWRQRTIGPRLGVWSRQDRPVGGGRSGATPPRRPMRAHGVSGGAEVDRASAGGMRWGSTRGGTAREWRSALQKSGARLERWRWPTARGGVALSGRFGRESRGAWRRIGAEDGARGIRNRLLCSRLPSAVVAALGPAGGWAHVAVAAAAADCRGSQSGNLGERGLTDEPGKREGRRWDAVLRRLTDSGLVDRVCGPAR
jgi:hypothetical protein